jgi:tetratricopeptide (TPR) repeat protein
MKCALCGASTPGPNVLCPACQAETDGGTDSQTREREDHVLPRPDVHASHSFAPGHTIGDRYRVVEEVGEGGMGQVYKAIDQTLGKAVALKLIHPQVAARAGAIGRFMRELQLAQQVTHRNVCRVHDLGEISGVPYITMEYIDGQTLKDLIHAMGRLSPLQTVTIARQVCAALEAIHERSIVHRDLKPGNIMVDRSGRVFVMDFGMAYHQGDDRMTDEGRIAGTLAYLSPEQARGQAFDWRSDIYSLGLVLFEMLTGQRPPADGLPLPLALRDSSEECPPPSRFAPEVPPSLDTVVLRCLERDPSRRFGSVRELDRALELVAAALPTPSGHARVLRDPRPIRYRLAFAVIAACVAGVLIWSSLSRPLARAPTTVALLPLAYEGPEENGGLKQIIPLLVGDRLRANPHIQVAPFAPADKGFDPKEEPRSVAEHLGVGAVVQGSLRVVGTEFQTSLRVVRAGAVSASWEGNLKGQVNNPYPVAEEAARGLVGALGGQAEETAPHRDLSAVAAYIQGRIFLEGWDVDKNYQRAEEAFARAVQADDSFAEAHAGLALALWTRYQQTREPEVVSRALGEAERAVALGPALPEAYLALGVVQLGQGRSTEAATSLTKAQALAPADDAISRRIGEAYAALGRYGEAEAQYQRAINLRPGYWWNYNAMGTYFWTSGKLDKARELYRQVIRLRPESDTGYNNLALTYLSAGQPKEAEPLLQAALKLHPSFESHNNLGAVYYETERYGDAIREYRQAAEAAPRHATPWANLGDSYRQLGRSADAKEAYARSIELGEAALRVNPSDGEGRALLATALAGTGRCPDARGEARRAAQDTPNGPSVHMYLAQAYIVCGDRALALEHTARAIEGGVIADVRTSPDLKPLLGDPSIRKLLH